MTGRVTTGILAVKWGIFGDKGKFAIVLHNNIHCGYSLESPRWGDSNGFWWVPTTHVFMEKQWKLSSNTFLICFTGLVVFLLACHTADPCSTDFSEPLIDTEIPWAGEKLYPWSAVSLNVSDGIEGQGVLSGSSLFPWRKIKLFSMYPFTLKSFVFSNQFINIIW